MVRTAVDPRPDHYRILGVAPDAGHDEIAAAFRSLAKRWHPDAPAGDAARFTEVHAAWEVLGDPARRLEYDLARRARLDAAARRTPVPTTQRVLPRPPTRRGAQAMLWGGIVATIAGLAVAVLTAALVADAARFRERSVAVDAVLVGPRGDREIEFTTRDGRTFRVPEPDAANPGVREDTLAIRYDPDDPTEVRVDESTLARDLTIGTVALKLLVAGPVFVVIGARRLRRLPKIPLDVRARGPA